MFQSTFPRGERHITVAEMAVDANVSIHVPTRGTTTDIGSLHRYLRFQSTFPRGERRKYRRVSVVLDSFNPRSHEGNDL